MQDLVLTTFDWVPDLPRGFVRDLRIRWALEEAGLPYRVDSTPFRDRQRDHFARQPFGQVPWLTHGDVTIFESGAILLYLAERNTALMPAEGNKRQDVITWLFAALNSVEAAVLPWALYKFTEDEEQTPGRKLMENFLQARLKHMEDVLTDRTWLAGSFSIADILMADVLRLVSRFDEMTAFPSCRAYIDRAMKRPAFAKAHADQLAHFAAAD